VSIGRDRATGTISNDDSPPATPVGVLASGDRTDQVRVTWTAASGADSYEIWRNTANSLPGSALATGATGTAYADTTATAGVTYYYWVRAVNSSGASGFSAVDSGIRLPVVSVVSSPVSVTEDSGTEIVYTFTRTGDLSAALTVGFSVAGTAAWGIDYTVTGAASYTATVGTATFGAGSATAVLRVRGVTDAVVENDETAVLTLTAGASYGVGG
jgi:hypothetical protein